MFNWLSGIYETVYSLFVIVICMMTKWEIKIYSNNFGNFAKACSCANQSKIFF